MFIAVDFDGTIVDHKYPDIGFPVPNAIEYLKKWQEDGAKIILFTMRSGAQLFEAVDYLKENGIRLYGQNANPSQARWTNSPKPYAHVYIDDAAAGVPLLHLRNFERPVVDWDAIATEIEVKLENFKNL